MCNVVLCIKEDQMDAVLGASVLGVTLLGQKKKM